MLRKILIYSDEGAHPFCLKALEWALKQECVDCRYDIVHARRDVFYKKEWQDDTELLIFPGGRDIPYHEALKGIANQRIREYVCGGGKYLGICAGGYYGSAFVDFERGGPLEVCGARELQFFAGVAAGPAYGLGKFNYHGEEGAQIATLNMLSSGITASYYHGGCAFSEAKSYPGCSVIAKYEDLTDQPAAIIKCSVGKGRAILSGVHPEYSAYCDEAKKYLSASFLAALKEIENKRRTLFVNILKQLDIGL